MNPMPESAQTTSEVDSPEAFAAYLESQEVPMTPAEQAWMRKFQADLDQSRMAGECDCEINVTHVTFNGNLTQEPLIQIFETGADCFPQPYFFFNANDVVTNSGDECDFPTSVTESVLDSSNSSISPNTADFNCNPDKGELLTIRANTRKYTDSSTSCTTTDGINVSVSIGLDVACFDSTLPFPPFQNDTYTLTVGANTAFNTARVALDNDCKPVFMTFGM